MTAVLVIGDIVTDVVAVLAGPITPASDTPATILITGGGAGANTAAWLAAAGVAVTLCGVVGADDAGDARLAELAAAGVTCAIQRAPEAATGSIVVLAERAERTMITDRGANLLLGPADVDAAMRAEPVHVHLSGYVLLNDLSRPAGLHALRVAAARGITTSVDAASAGPLREVGGRAFLEWIAGTGIVFANADEVAALLDRPENQADAPVEALAAALAAGSTAVLKQGARGAVSCSGGDVHSVPAAPATVVDTTGAGDAFAAGYLAAWLAGTRDPEVLLTAGATLAARAVATIGARPS